MIDDDEELNIYTDGSCKPNPGPGGVGILFVTVNDEGNEVEQALIRTGYIQATNNEMELQACILALEEVHKPKETSIDLDKIKIIIIHTDSLYVKNGFTKDKYYWIQNNWKRMDKGPVLNAQLWKKLIALDGKIKKKVEIKWVKGHAKNKHNITADRLADESRKMPFNKSLKPVSVRRKLTHKPTKIGSVGMDGQRITIRICETQYLTEHKIWRYRYEVMSKKSPYYMNASWITSTILLRDGHNYYVRLNDNSSNPQILKKFREID